MDKVNFDVCSQKFPKSLEIKTDIYSKPEMKQNMKCTKCENVKKFKTENNVYVQK